MGGGSGGESAAMSPPSSSGSGGKRGRDPEEDVYVDNLHSHKRYLSEIMASSLNGLSVGDSLADNIMESPVRSESPSCLRDDITSQYSPMSEDSDDYRYLDTQLNPSGSQTDPMVSPSTSPMSSPHRFQKTQAGFLPSNPYPLPNCSLSAVACSHARRSSENEGRFPSSPNDMCHGADLRRTALLRSVKIRVHEEQEHVHEHEDEHGHEDLEALGGAERSSCGKSIDDEAGYGSPGNSYVRPEHDLDYIGDCASDDGMSDPRFKQEDNRAKFDTSMNKNR